MAQPNDTKPSTGFWVEEPRPDHRIRLPARLGWVSTGEANSVERDERGNVPLDVTIPPASPGTRSAKWTTTG